jgi:hypothetical protein
MIRPLLGALALLALGRRLHAESFELSPNGRALRFTTDDVTLGLDGIEEIDPIAGGGADTFAIGDLRRTDAQRTRSTARASRLARSGLSFVDYGPANCAR